MLEDNKKLFDAFKKTHDAFAKDHKTWRIKFNEEGEQVMTVIRKYENELCGRSEDAGFGHYTSKLAEKFWGEIRLLFPEIDEIGIE